MDAPNDRYPIPAHAPVYHLEPSARRVSRGRFYTVLDSVFAGLGLLLTFWFVITLFLSSLTFSWQSIVLLLAFWFVLTYLALPRLHQLFTTLYVPDYFMARTKTADGLLGDPVNLALMGSEADIHAAMRRANWIQADPITLRSSLGIIKSSVTRKSYPAAPVSDLYLFGRKHDFAYQQEVDGNASQRHHVRFWRVPEGWTLPGGQHVEWLAAGTYDKSVGLSSLTLQITHKIDENIDAERDYIIDTVRYQDHDCDVDVIEQFSTAFHDRNGGGDAVRTDGHMPVLDVTGAAERAHAQGIDLHQDESIDVSLPNSSVDGALDKETPPTSLTMAGIFLAIRLLIVAVATVVTVSTNGGNGADIGGELIGFAIVLALQVGLYIYTLKRRRWARLILLILATFSAVVHNYMVTVDETPTLLHFADAGTALALVLALSAPSAREWVDRIRRRGGDAPIGY